MACILELGSILIILISTIYSWGAGPGCEVVEMATRMDVHVLGSSLDDQSEGEIVADSPLYSPVVKIDES